MRRCHLTTGWDGRLRKPRLIRRVGEGRRLGFQYKESAVSPLRIVGAEREIRGWQTGFRLGSVIQASDVGERHGVRLSHVRDHAGLALEFLTPVSMGRQS